MIFKWDPRKAVLNFKKHGVHFHEAATVLNDPLSTTFPDPDHSRMESRYLTIGVSDRQQLLVVSHAEEGQAVRIITARRVMGDALKKFSCGETVSGTISPALGAIPATRDQGSYGARRAPGASAEQDNP